MNMDHRELDHIGGGALDGRIDSVAFGGAADRVVGGADVTQVPAASSDSFNVTVVSGKCDGVIHVFAQPWELFEILVDDFSGLFPRDAQPLGQAKRRYPVSDSVVYHFGFAPHLGRDHFWKNSVDFSGGGSVDICPRPECLE